MKRTRGKRATLAWILALVMLALLGLFVAAGFAQSDEGQASPQSQEEQQLALTLQKDSDVSVAMVGQSVVYTVTINNPGPLTETVAIVSDTLPSGFTFEMMSVGSDLLTPPEGTTGTLIWMEPITIPAGESRRLVYQVDAGATGFKENRVGAQTVGGDPLESASVTVRVDPMSVYLPAVLRLPASSTLPFEDTFETGLAPGWEVFTNYPGLDPDDWYWHEWGWYIYEPMANSEWDGYALSMYLGPGSSEWTDYEVVTTIRDRGDKIAGLWVRGTYEDLNDNGGGRVGGYYVCIRPGDNSVRVLRIRPTTRLFWDIQEVAAALYPPGIGTKKWYSLKVAVQGANMKVWLKEELEPDSAYVRVINWTDSNQTYMQGTVGFSAFRARFSIVYDDIKVTALPANTR